MKKLFASFVIALFICGFIQLIYRGIEVGVDRLEDVLSDLDISNETVSEAIIGSGLVCSITLVINDRVFNKEKEEK